MDHNFKLEKKYLEMKRLVMEKTEELKRRDKIISLLEHEIDERDATIRYLKNEIDKFRQVVKPLTRQMIDKRRNGFELSEDECFLMKGPGVENTRILPLMEPRLKRTAISAEPLSSLSQSDGMKLVKIPKNQATDSPSRYTFSSPFGAIAHAGLALGYARAPPIAIRSQPPAVRSRFVALAFQTISRELIKSAILDNDFMKNLEMTQIREIVDCMYPVQYAAGSLIIKEGDVGSIVYVMEEYYAKLKRIIISSARGGGGKTIVQYTKLCRCEISHESVAMTYDSRIRDRERPWRRSRPCGLFAPRGRRRGRDVIGRGATSPGVIKATFYYHVGSESPPDRAPGGGALPRTSTATSAYVTRRRRGQRRAGDLVLRALCC
ncbi:hypothetical protein EVAR_46632_1 [Eumeta japonica]|uniref:Cyclic nucleotide-binding domain-containing protein n=1 Tax=Eumeta variegata TaxID=151549 RepID=A0A4C1WGP4_EUMVA|nr:hypothetical protein EVAR_46632_1 [Eumeta japonica]